MADYEPDIAMDDVNPDEYAWDDVNPDEFARDEDAAGGTTGAQAETDFGGGTAGGVIPDANINIPETRLTARIKSLEASGKYIEVPGLADPTSNEVSLYEKRELIDHFYTFLKNRGADIYLD
jgi:hypothetical protein